MSTDATIDIALKSLVMTFVIFSYFLLLQFHANFLSLRPFKTYPNLSPVIVSFVPPPVPPLLGATFAMDGVTDSL